MSTNRHIKIFIVFGYIIIGNFASTSMGQDTDSLILKEVARVVEESKEFGRDLTEYPEGMSNAESVISLGNLLARSSATDIVSAASSVEESAKLKMALKIGLEQLEPRLYLSALSSILESTTLKEESKIGFLKSPDLYKHLLADNWETPSVINFIDLARQEISDPAFLRWLLEIESGAAKKRIDEYRAAVGGSNTVIEIVESYDLGGTAQTNVTESEEAALQVNPESANGDLETEATGKSETPESPSLPKWALAVVVVAVLGILALLVRAFWHARAS